MEEFRRSDKIEKIIADFFAWNVRNHPVRATRIGIFDNAEDLEDFSSRNTERERIFLTNLLERCQNAESDSFSQNQRHDLQLINSATQSWIFRTDHLKELERDPDYLSLIFRSIFFVLEQPQLTNVRKVQFIGRRLAKVPRYLEIAELNLKDPDSVLLQNAIANTTALLNFISHIAVEASKWDLRADSMRVLQQGISHSTKSIARYGKFLHTLRSSSTRHYQIADQDFELLLKIRGIPFSTSDILKMAFERIETCRQTLTGIAEEFDQGVSWESITLPSQTTSLFEASREYNETMFRTRDFMLQNLFMTLPENECIEVQSQILYPHEFVSNVAYVHPSKFSNPLVGRLVFGEQSNGFISIGGRSEINLVVSHEAYPGHHVRNLFANKHPSLARVFPADMTVEEGWACYSENFVVTTKFDASPESRFLLESNRLWRAVQAVGDIVINTGRSNLKQVTEFVSSATGRQDEIVKEELESYSAKPGLGLSRFVGEETISRLRRATSVQFSIQDFHTKLLQQGNVSLSILLDIFGITASELVHLDES